MTLLDESGQPVSSSSEVLAPEARSSLFFTEAFFGAITSDFRGSVLVEAVNGRFAMIGLELGSAPGEFTTLPVSVVP